MAYEPQFSEWLIWKRSMRGEDGTYGSSQYPPLVDVNVRPYRTPFNMEVAALFSGAMYTTVPAGPGAEPDPIRQIHERLTPMMTEFLSMQRTGAGIVQLPSPDPQRRWVLDVAIEYAIWLQQADHSAFRWRYNPASNARMVAAISVSLLPVAELRYWGGDNSAAALERRIASYNETTMRLFFPIEEEDVYPGRGRQRASQEEVTQLLQMTVAVAILSSSRPFAPHHRWRNLDDIQAQYEGVLNGDVRPVDRPIMFRIAASTLMATAKIFMRQSIPFPGEPPGRFAGFFPRRAPRLRNESYLNWFKERVRFRLGFEIWVYDGGEDDLIQARASARFHKIVGQRPLSTTIQHALADWTFLDPDDPSYLEYTEDIRVRLFREVQTMFRGYDNHWMPHGPVVIGRPLGANERHERSEYGVFVTRTDIRGPTIRGDRQHMHEWYTRDSDAQLEQVGDLEARYANPLYYLRKVLILLHNIQHPVLREMHGYINRADFVPIYETADTNGLDEDGGLDFGLDDPIFGEHRGDEIHETVHELPPLVNPDE